MEAHIYCIDSWFYVQQIKVDAKVLYSINSLLWATKETVCIIERIPVYTIWQISPKGSFTEKNVSKIKKIFFFISFFRKFTQKGLILHS